MSNADKIKYRKLKATPAEDILKRKYEETLALRDEMRRKNDSEEQLERRLAQQRQQARLQAMQAAAEQQRQQAESARAAADQTSSGAALSVQNNINVNINYTVNQTTADSAAAAGSRRKSSKKGKKGPSAKQREKELMNSSLSKMLDQQLLASNSSPDPSGGTRNLASNVADSLTQKIFHGDKIYLDQGAMAFKPLGMETVLESVDEQPGWKKKLSTQANRYKSHRLAPQTTEQNIALQQSLDFASAEEFITFGRFSQLGLRVKEDVGAAQEPGENAYGDPTKTPAGLYSMPSVNVQQRAVPVSKTVAGKGPTLPRKSASMALQQVRSKSSLKGALTVDQSPLKRPVPEESRQVHAGLRQMEARLQAKTEAVSTPHKRAPYNFDERSNFSSAYQRDAGDSAQFVSPTPQPLLTNQSVQFDQGNSSINQIVARQMQQQQLSARHHVTGAAAAEGKVAVRSPQPGPGLHRQMTKNTKEFKRKMRMEAMREGILDYEDMDESNFSQQVIEADTVLAEQEPLIMPHRMKSNATFQPKSQKIEPSIKVEQADIALQGSGVSQLAIDYGMHQQNKKRIQNLMALLGAKGAAAVQSIDDLDINIGDSMSNVDAVSHVTKSKQSKMASVSQRIQEIVSNEHGSTQGGTNAKASVLNQASSGKHPDQSGSRANANARQAVFESSVGAYSNHDADNNSMLNQSIEGSEGQYADRRPARDERKRIMRSHLSHLGNVKAINDAHIDGLTSIQHLMKAGDLRKSEQSPDMFLTRNPKNYGIRERNSMRTTNNSGLNSLKKNPKYALVRSSMFNKNPIFDRMDVQMLSINDGESDKLSTSTGLKSHLPQRGIGRDYFSVIGAKKVAYTEETERRSMRTINNRSMSSKKIRPITQNKLPWKDDKSKPNAQSLQFNKGLSYVMIKGKVQPSEKYIYKSMMPYTSAQQFQSVQIKSSKDRHSLVLQQVEAQQSHQNQPGRDGGKKEKTRKLKGSKMARNESMKVKRALTNGGGHGESSIHRGGRKTVIMEMEEEYSGSDGGRDLSPDAQQATWQELMEENNQMKDSILNQIAIFEQYLKVAILQHKARQQAEQDEANQNGTKHSSADYQLFKGAKDFQFDDKALKQQYLKTISKRETATNSKKQSQLTSAKKASKQKQALVQQSRAMKIVTPIHHSSQPSLGVSRRSSPTRGSIQSKQFTIATRGLSKNSQRSSMEDLQSEKDGRSESPAKVKFIMSKKVTSHNKMKALEHLLPVQGATQNTSNLAHITHQNLIAKIETLWRRLNRRKNQEIVSIQNEIKRNKKHIAELTRENLFELDVNFQDQQIFLSAKSKFSSLNRRIKYGQEQKQVRELQSRIRDEIAKKADFDTWGFHNHIIEYRLKVRMTEDVIDCAQRLQVKSDQKTMRELELLKMLRDRTYDDLKFFVQEREKKPWRVWDKFGYNYKPDIENLSLNLRQLNERIEVHMQMIAFIEPKYLKLVRDIPPYNAINSEMIQFCTEMFGNEGWLQMFQIRQLRRQQEDEQHDKQYMPPVEHIKRFEVDPYTLQIESGAESPEREAGDAEEQAEETKQPQPKWWARLPDKPSQGKLKTGYEPIIAERERQKAMLIEQEERRDSRDGSLLDGKSSKLVNKRSSLPISIEKRDDSGEVQLDVRSQAVLSENYGPVSGFGQNKFDGDVVQHLKDKVSEHEVREKVQQEVEAIKKSSWLQVLEKERAAKAEREAAERKQRAARLAILFEEEDVLSQDDEDILDAGAARQDVQDYIEKIDTHLQVEKKILEAWQENDQVEGGPLRL